MEIPSQSSKTTMQKTPLDWSTICAFALLHLACGLVFWVGWSWVALTVFVLSWASRTFALTAFYHRYFSHRSYKTGRLFQCLMAFFGAMALQRGPLWWAAVHRHHHRYSDQEEDVHSAKIGGVWWAHVGWMLSQAHKDYEPRAVKDLYRYPELRWIDRFYLIPPLLFAGVLYGVGAWLQFAVPELGTSGMQCLVWGFVVGTVVLYHTTWSINSFSHLIGSRRFDTKDDSRNHWLLALLTFGEGWHNNHHRYPGSERQGFYWWEIDISHIGLKCLSWCRVVWDLREPPPSIYREAERQRLSR